MKYYVIVLSSDGPLIDSIHENRLEALIRAEAAKNVDGYKQVKITSKPIQYGLDPQDEQSWVNGNPASSDLVVQRIVGLFELIRESAPFWSVLERMDMKPLTEDDDSAYIINVKNAGIALGFHERQTAARWMREGDPKDFEVKVVQIDRDAVGSVYYGDDIITAAETFVSLVGRSDALMALIEAEQSYEQIVFDGTEGDEYYA